MKKACRKNDRPQKMYNFPHGFVPHDFIDPE